MDDFLSLVEDYQIMFGEKPPIFGLDLRKVRADLIRALETAEPIDDPARDLPEGSLISGAS